MQIFTIGTFGIIIIVQFYKNNLWYFTQKAKSQWNETLDFLSYWVEGHSLLSKKRFLASDCKKFPCLTIKTYNLSRQAMKRKATNFSKITIFHHLNTYLYNQMLSNWEKNIKCNISILGFLKTCKKLLPIWCGNSLINNHFFFFLH